MLTCYLTRRRLDAYVDGALDPGAARSVASHVETCARCHQGVVELRKLRGLLRSHLAPSEPDWTGFWQGVVRGIEDGRSLRRVPVARPWWHLSAAWRPRWALGGALAAALLMSVGIWEWMPGGRAVSDAGVLVTSASTDDPRGTVMVYSTPEQDVAVVWVLGLDKD